MWKNYNTYLNLVCDQNLPMLLIFKGTLGIVFAEGQMQFKPWDKLCPTTI